MEAANRLRGFGEKRVPLPRQNVRKTVPVSFTTGGKATD